MRPRNAREVKYLTLVDQLALKLATINLPLAQGSVFRSASALHHLLSGSRDSA